MTISSFFFSVIKASSLAGAFFLGLVYCMNLHAQTNSEYNFQQMSVVDNHGDTVINLTTDCLAANGYGQWTVSHATGSPSNKIQQGWFLLGNALPENHTTSSIISPGVVASGGFIPGDVPLTIASAKVTCNLVGQVRYVSPNLTTFAVQGLNDQRAASGFRQINIATLGPVNPPKSRQAVTGIIQAFTPISTLGNCPGSHTPAYHNIFGETDTRNQFDIACDATYLYIVWESETNICGTATREIWATVVDMTNCTTQSGFPMKVSTTTIGGTTVDHSGKFPTVACDVRNNGSGTTTPRFDVAFIDQNTGEVVVQEFLNTSVVTGHAEILTKTFRDPFHPLEIAHDHTYTTAEHVRVLVSSVAGSSTPSHSVYVLDDYNTTTSADHDLIFYNTLTWNPVTDKAWYVDGSYDYGPVFLPSPIDTSVHSADGVVDKPITAFIDPYDNQDLSGGFSQYHCLYQPLVNGAKPLVIVRAAMINYGTPSSDTRCILNQSGGSLEDDPLNYCGAVNQMGIHVHWRADSTHFYARDTGRTIDENIEENTLATYICRVTNGTSHGGTQTPEVLPGVTLTIWSDPNWFKPDSLYTNTGTSVISHGAFASGGLSFYVSNFGMLRFGGDSVVLKVGEYADDNSSGAALVMMPFTWCDFPSAFSKQGLTINPRSSLEYFPFTNSSYISTNGSEITPNPYNGRNRFQFHLVDGATPYFGSVSQIGTTMDILGRGTVSLQGKTVRDTVNYANLHLHGGSVFSTTGLSSFISYKGDIESLFEPCIYPQWFDAVTPQGADYYPSTGTPNPQDYMNPPEPGSMQLYGNTSITQSIVNSHEVAIRATDPAFDNIITIHGCLLNASTTEISFTTFTNAATTWLGDTTWQGRTIVQGLSRLVLFPGNQSNGSSYISPKVTLDESNFSSWQFAAYDQQRPLNAYYNSFEHNRNAAINLQRDLGRTPPVDYDSIAIASNVFRTFRAAGASIDPYPTAGLNLGICLFGYDESLMIDTEGDPLYHPRILVESNFFNTATGNTIFAGLYLDNTDASLLSNQVTKNNYQYGIFNWSSLPVPFKSHTFLCSNIIQNATIAGIYTKFWLGYSKLNEIDSSAIGHKSDIDQFGAGIDFCKYHDNIAAGLLLINSSTMDISGLHTGGNDYAGSNTFANNNTQASSSTSGQVEMASGVDLQVGATSLSFSTYGKNNFIGNSSSDNLIFSSGGSSNIHGLAQNFWGYGASGTTPTAIILSGTSNSHLPNVTYSNPAPSSSPFSFSGVSCGLGFNELVKNSNNHPLSVLIDTGAEACQALQDALSSIAHGSDFQKQYDSARYVIEHCATQQDLFPKIWKDFGVVTSGAQDMSNDLNRWPTYREWLKKVIYLNMDTNYYCSDVLEILSTMQYFSAERGYDENGAIAILKFLNDSNRCISFFTPSIGEIWKNGRLQQFTTWRDTVHDPDKTPLDTTLPSLEDLNLEILRGPQYAAVKDAFTPSTVSKIQYLIASENPFTDETKLRFGLADAEYMKIELFDLLGNKVYSDSKLFTGGDEEWLIDGKSLAQGGLYARLSTMGGQVKSVKLVHE